MLLQTYQWLWCLLQTSVLATTIPTEQQPMTALGSHNVQAVRAALKKAEIIPTVIDDFLPSLTLSVTWSSKHAKLGNTLQPKNLQDQPKLILRDTTTHSPSDKDSELSYIVTLTDPDAPSRDDPKWSEFCHWIATNLFISSKVFNIVPLPNVQPIPFAFRPNGEPQDVIEYKPPGPPPKTGKHRYVFLVFAAKNGTSEALHPSKPGDRQHWGTGEVGGGVRGWAESNGLVPVAANFIYAQNEEQ